MFTRLPKVGRRQGLGPTASGQGWLSQGPWQVHCDHREGEVGGQMGKSADIVAAWALPVWSGNRFSPREPSR